MAEISSIPPVPQARRKPIVLNGNIGRVIQARRKPIVLNANIGRVITRPYIPPTEERIRNIINRVLDSGRERGRYITGIRHVRLLYSSPLFQRGAGTKFQQGSWPRA